MRPRWSWAGASVLVLAIFLGGGWAAALVMAASSRTPPISGETGDLLNSVGGVLAGAITAYIGGHIASMHKRNEKLTDDDDPPEPPIA
jgi:hypothetical protein